jgi:beta-carotene hydroxylase
MLDFRRARGRTLAWPTLLLAAFAFVAWCVQFWLGVSGLWPGWAVVLGNAVCAYAIYITAHDAAHGAISRAGWVNDWIGRVTLLLITPVIAFAPFRYLHLQHHRVTNEPEGDPDMWASGQRWWSLAFRFATIDFAYCVFYVRRMRARPRREIVEGVLSVAASLSLVALLFGLGLGKETLLFWILSGRITVFFLAWLLDYLPHRPHDVAHRENAFRATNVRVGAERWLSPLLLWQNYHLVHHLYPAEPFYKTVDVWRAKERWHLQQSPFLVDVWGRPLSVAAYSAARGISVGEGERPSASNADRVAPDRAQSA